MRLAHRWWRADGGAVERKGIGSNGPIWTGAGGRGAAARAGGVFPVFRCCGLRLFSGFVYCTLFVLVSIMAIFSATHPHAGGKDDAAMRADRGAACWDVR